MPRKKKTDSETEMKIELNKKITKTKKALHNLVSYIDDVYCLSTSDGKDDKHTQDSMYKDQKKSSYETLRNHLKKVFGDSGFNSLDFLKNREVITKFLMNLVDFEVFQKELLRNIKDNAEKLSVKKELSNNLTAKYFFENAVSLEEKLNGEKLEVPSRYEMELQSLNGKNIKDIFVNLNTAELRPLLRWLNDGEDLEIDPTCEEITDVWLKDNLNLNLREAYEHGQFVFSTFGYGEELRNFLNKSVRENYLNMSKIGKTVNYLNISREISGSPSIKLERNINEKTGDWLGKFHNGIRTLYDMTKDKPKTPEYFAAIFENDKDFESFLNAPVCENYDKTGDSIAEIIQNRLFRSDIKIDPLCEDKTGEWIKTNLYVDLEKLFVLSGMFQSKDEINSFLNMTVKESLQYLVEKEYGNTLESYFDKVCCDIESTMMADISSIKEIDNGNLKLAAILLYSDIYNSIMPDLQAFLRKIIINDFIQTNAISNDKVKNDDKIIDLELKEIYRVLEINNIGEINLNTLSYEQLEVIESLLKNYRDGSVLNKESFESTKEKVNQLMERYKMEIARLSVIKKTLD